MVIRSVTPKKVQSKYATRDVDYKQLTSVRIDAKTVIYVKSGEDAALAKKNYLMRLQQSHDYRIGTARDSKEVKKFKQLK